MWCSNFGIPYGRGELAIAQQVKAETGSSKSIAELASEVGQMITAWKTTTYPQAWKYLCECQQKVYNPGYIVNPWGRMRRFPGVKEKRADLERQAGNFNIQSTVADTAMIAMDLIDRYRLEHGLHFKIQNQIHDALMLEVPHAEIEECREMLKNTMGNIKIPVGGKLGTLVLGIDIDV